MPAPILFGFTLQDKMAKEVNFILTNQETIQNQITQLEAAIKQMEVLNVFFLLLLKLQQSLHMHV